ncbi:TetR/AcrR family transcriptional regulator [Pseudomonas sp.]|jgi:TetR/AcrR family transcriptional repressor of mexJK operon|uniref:TetR/AcrR family transcriptional regulator n=1 Tax=Pseudomonas sp. TaxID=306 RepID=UPI0019E53365|nr:TetR/AcrR family transcriptional regulator [Pseudomonas sp.]MBF0675894.1 TetR/AcrR family transcriptional regulator [Pseudomonas sp.]
MSEHALPNQGPGRPKDPAKRQAILEAAKSLFLRHGYEGSSMDAIAREAGVSKLTVYSHFTDKDTLFCAAVEAKCEEQLPQLFTEPSAAEPIDAHLVAIGRAFHALISSEESLAMHRLMFTLAKPNPQLVQLFYAAGPQRILDKMERVMHQADQAGTLRIPNPQAAAEHFCSLLKGGHNFRQLIGCATCQGNEEAERHVREVVGLFIRAYSV